jgi:hypothetical protein
MKVVERADWQRSAGWKSARTPWSTARFAGQVFRIRLTMAPAAQSGMAELGLAAISAAS